MRNAFKLLILIPLFFLASCKPAVKENEKKLSYKKETARFLEEAEGKEALAWAQAHSKETIEKIEKDPRYGRIKKILERVSFDKSKGVYCDLYDGYVYQFWTDDRNPSGIWRRMPLKTYKKQSNQWEVLIDFDALTKLMGKKIVFKEAVLCRQNPNRYFIIMSFGNKDEAFAREWDLPTKQFVEDGFVAKREDGSYVEDKLKQIAWLDKDTVLLAFSKDKTKDRSSAGYPKDLYLWKRGEPIEKAKKIHSITANEIAVSIGSALNNEHESSDLMFSVWKDFYRRQNYVVDHAQNVRKVYVPEDSVFIGDFGPYKFLRLRSDWTVGDKIYKKDSVLSLPLQELYVEDSRKKGIELVFEPQPHLSFYGIVSTKNAVFLLQLNHVKPEIFWFKREGNVWSPMQKVFFDSEIGDMYIASSVKDEVVLLNFESFIHPLSFYGWDESQHKFELIRKSEDFPSESFVQEQRFAVSKDGTKVPYFLVYKKGTRFDGKNPTLLYAYGGFQSSILPYYSRWIGNVWLKNGGVYVLANIRGGGEYGTKWHDSARKDKRQKAFDDFLAVAEGMIHDKVTSSQHLGIQGGSNGGLLVTVAMTQRPDLFGAVISNVPILDMERYTEFGAGTSWIEEYGDPADPEMLDYLGSYSPLQNIYSHIKYPALLLTASPQDQRVHPWHARIMKWLMDQHPSAKTYFIEKEDAGHGNGADLSEVIDTKSREFAFLAETLGLEVKD